MKDLVFIGSLCLALCFAALLLWVSFCENAERKLWWFCRMVVRALCGLPVLMLFAGCAAHPPAPIAARIAPPQPPQFSAVTAAAVPAPVRQFSLSWSNWPAGVSNVLQYGPVIDVWRVQPLGVTNRWVLDEPDSLTFYRVLPVLGGQPGQPSNVVKYPGDDVLGFYFSLDGREEILRVFTNQPPGSVGMFYHREWKSYEP